MRIWVDLTRCRLKPDYQFGPDFFGFGPLDNQVREAPLTSLVRGPGWS